MNPYPLNTVFKLMQDAGVRHIHAELTNHAGRLGPAASERRLEECVGESIRGGLSSRRPSGLPCAAGSPKGLCYVQF